MTTNNDDLKDVLAAFKNEDERREAHKAAEAKRQQAVVDARRVATEFVDNAERNLGYALDRLNNELKDARRSVSVGGRGRGGAQGGKTVFAVVLHPPEGAVEPLASVEIDPKAPLIRIIAYPTQTEIQQRGASMDQNDYHSALMTALKRRA